MWIYNKDKSKWEVKSGSLSKSSFDTYKQELSSTRFYAKCLSGATYLPTNNLSDIYDTLKYKDKKNWFIPISSSQYSVTPMPIDDATPIESDNSDLYYDKNLTDYNLTLKNKFTPNKLIKDSIDNYYYVDISTTEQIDITDSFLRGKIDGVRLLKGHKILVKDQKTKSSLNNSTYPDTFFVGNYTKLEQIGLTTEYEYYNEENGIYEFDGEFLIKVSEFDEYENAFRYSVVTKLGTNVGKQFHLSRLLNGYYPNESEPKEFLEHKNWMIRNKLDYNNICGRNYYESLKHSDQEIDIAGITYSIPERTISVGEFGVILDTQSEFGDISNIIKNKFKVDLFSVTETKLFYWTCGQKGTLLRVNKHDFKIEKIKLPKILGSLNCVRFLTDKKGIVVGDFNTILITNDGGNIWEKIDVSKFSNFDYNKCIYYSPTKFFVVGENGVFIEFEKSISGFKAYKRRLSKFTERLEDEYLLVDDINDIISANINWNLEFNGVDTNINDDFIFITTNDNNIIMYDINENFKDFKFLYLDFNDNYGDITNIVKGKSKEVEYEFMSDKFGSTLNDTEYSYVNKLFVEYTSLTNFKVGDMINIYDVSDTDIINDYTDIDTTTGLDFTILEIIPTLSGEKIVFNVTSTISTPITETTGKSKLIRTPDEFYFSSDTGVHIFSFENFSKLDTTTGIYNMVNITTLNTINPLVNNVVEIDNKYYNDLFNYDDVSSDEELILSGNESLLKSYDYDINTILLNDIIDSGFYDRNKSKMLFMNYDIASKLNFFRDNGEYRLPEPIEFISSLFISHVEFENTIVSGNIESNWINYWQDSLQTFEYNTIDGLSETTKVLFSTKFKLAGAATYKRTIPSDNIAVGNKPLFGSTNVDDIDILDLAPEIDDDSVNNRNRFYGTSVITAPTSTTNSNPTKELFLYKYLMIVRLYNVYPVDKGDVVRLTCDDVDGNIIIETNLIINKIETFGSDNYIYMYTEFNDNIIKSIKENGCYLDNLNKYSDAGELEDNFKKHPLSIAYDLKLEPADIPSNVNYKISAKFNNKTAYYNLGTSVNTPSGLFDMKYTDCFVDFGYSPIYNIYDYLRNINSVLFTPDKEYLAMPVYKNIPLGSLTPSVGYIDTGISNNNKILLGTDLKFEWESVFIDTFIDVDIVTETTNEVSTIDNPMTTPSYIGSNHMFVDGGNGFAYSAPGTSGVILKLNLSNDTITTFGSYPSGGTNLYYNGVLSPTTGKIYFVPSTDVVTQTASTPNILVIDPTDDSESYIPWPYDTSSQFNDLSITPDGIIYLLGGFFTSNQDIIKIDTNTENITLISTPTPTGTSSTEACSIYSISGYFYLIVNMYDTIYKIDPTDDSVTTISATIDNNSNDVTLVETSTGIIYGIFGGSSTVPVFKIDTSDDSVINLPPLPTTSFITSAFIQDDIIYLLSIGGSIFSINTNDNDSFNNIYTSTLAPGFVGLHISLIGYSAYSIGISLVNPILKFTLPITYSTEKLLVMDKYYDEPNDAYAIEFHKKIEFDGTDANILNGNGSLNIISRRKLSQISDDLRILNNIHRTKKSKKITTGSEYFVYDNELTTKIKTNSYTNILLSDQVTKDNLTAVIYTDDTNELSMNILNLDEEINPVVNGIVESNGKVSIIFKDKHNLSEHDLISILYSGDSVLTADNGCFPNSSSYDPNFFGSHVISIISPNSILLDIPWNPLYSLNKFTISFTKTDSFLDYTPIDLVDIGVDKKGKTAIELLPENSLFKGNKYELVDVNFNKFRYRLFDGLTINDLIVRYPWILEAEISNATIGLVNDELTWYSGVWECGRWFEGNWMSGQWMSGDFYGGTWNAKKVIDKKINIEIADKKTIDDESIWHGGRWFDGTWNGGVWRTGRWYAGDFNSGKWLDGIWNDGTFNNGTWNGGIWVLGNWNNGLFNTDNKPSYWIDGKFNGGDFGNGIWYNGTFESKKATARFGTESFNSRPSIWHGGNFVSGSFHSFLDKDDDDNIVRSKIHKYSIWNTGNFISGDFYGGVAYNIDFNGTWHGGILEDIQIIDMEDIIDTLTGLTTGKKLTLNGIFRFNIGNEITIMDKDLNTYKTKVRLPVEEDTDSFTTKVETIPDVGITIPIPFEKDKYKVVSEFNNTNWKSGIWTNGVFNSGLWEGGMFYDGIFNGVSI